MNKIIKMIKIIKISGENKIIVNAATFLFLSVNWILSQKRLRSSKEETIEDRRKKWRWNEHDGWLWRGVMIASFGRETSGFFNAGLTPCSHTTTTTRNRHQYFLSIDSI